MTRCGDAPLVRPPRVGTRALGRPRFLPGPNHRRVRVDVHSQQSWDQLDLCATLQSDEIRRTARRGEPSSSPVAARRDALRGEDVLVRGSEPTAYASPFGVSTTRPTTRLPKTPSPLSPPPPEVSSSAPDVPTRPPSRESRRRRPVPRFQPFSTDPSRASDSTPIAPTHPSLEYVATSARRRRRNPSTDQTLSRSRPRVPADAD